MAKFNCIDPTIANEGQSSSALTSGSAQLTPWKYWASVTWTAGDTYKQLASTTANEAVTIGTTGTVTSAVTMGMYGSGNRPTIDAGQTDVGILGNGKSYVTITDFIVKNASGAGNVSFPGTATRGPTGVRLRRLRCTNNTTGDGINLGGGTVGQATYSNVIITSCSCASNGNGGIDIGGAITGSVSIEFCTVWGNGLVSNSWGIHVQTVEDQWTTASMTSLGSDVYTVAMKNGGNANLKYVSVVRSSNSLDWRMTAVTSASKNALGIGEYCIDNSGIRFKAGGPLDAFDSQVVRAAYAGASGVVIADCVAYAQLDVDGADGTGIGFDHFVSNSIIKRCYTSGNARSGCVLNNVTSCEVSWSYANSNSVRGFAMSLGGGSNKIINCTAVSNSVNFYVGQCRTTDAFLNVIAYGAGHGYVSSADSGSASVNAVINWGASTSIGWASATSADPIFLNSIAPMIYSIAPAGSGGTSAGGGPQAGPRGMPDLYGRRPAGHIPKGCTYFIPRGPSARSGL